MNINLPCDVNYIIRPISLKDLEINGSDLIEIGYIGKEIGIMLNELLDMVIDNPNCNDKDYLLSVAKDDK